MPASAGPDGQPPKPWGPFLAELDTLLETPIALHCMGGFVVTQQYGVGRETADIDFYSAVPYYNVAAIEELGGQGSALHRKHRLYMQYVGVSTPPADYQKRLA